MRHFTKNRLINVFKSIKININIDEKDINRMLEYIKGSKIMKMKEKKIKNLAGKKVKKNIENNK